MTGFCGMARSPRRLAQGGAAILMAMLVVVLVATMASAMMWQQWRAVEVESAQRTRVQSAWILTGALDWARLILREDSHDNDNLSEAWAVPLAPARLSTFLAADHGEALVSDDSDPDQEAFLSGGIQDLQARLNVANLVGGGKLNESSLAAWGRLFNLLNLPKAELDVLAQSLLQANSIAASSNSDAPVPLVPKRVADLAWLGLSAATLQTIDPCVTLLPERTPVNLNTAPPEVLMAVLPGLDLAQARQLVQLRSVKPFGSLADAQRVTVNSSLHFDPAEHSVFSRYFGVVGQLRLGQNTLQERSVLRRDGSVVTVLSRAKEVLTTPVAPLQ